MHLDKGDLATDAHQIPPRGAGRRPRAGARPHGPRSRVGSDHDDPACARDPRPPGEPRRAHDNPVVRRAPLVDVRAAPAHPPGGDRARAPAAAHHPVRAGLADGGPGPRSPGKVDLLSRASTSRPGSRPASSRPPRRQPAAEREHLRHAPGPPAHLRLRQDRRRWSTRRGRAAASRRASSSGCATWSSRTSARRTSDLLQARRLVGVADAALARSELNLRSARGFFDVGTKPKSDVTRAEVEVANARVDVIRAGTSSA